MCQTDLHNAVANGAILPLSKHHQTGHYHSCYGNRNHQQANQSAIPKAKLLPQGANYLQSPSASELLTQEHTSACSHTAHGAIHSFICINMEITLACWQAYRGEHGVKCIPVTH